MKRALRVGDRVSWDSEAGRVTGVIKKKITTDTLLKGRVRHASRADPQFVIKSELTHHVAIHKAHALRRIRRTAAKRTRPTG
jgi:hypothetical protein